MAYAERFPTATFTPADPSDDHNTLWEVPADCAFPSATQNEINGKDAANLISNGVFRERGANMPTVPEGIDQFVTAGVLYGPGRPRTPGASP